MSPRPRRPRRPRRCFGAFQQGINCVGGAELSKLTAIPPGSVFSSFVNRSKIKPQYKVGFRPGELAAGVDGHGCGSGIMVAGDVSFDQAVEPLRQRIEARLAEYVTQKPDCPERLREAMAYSLLAGGKRLRPLLLLLACEACGGEIEGALPAACALEMVHTYSLIHDDLPAMDNDDLRRGRPTNHVVYGEALAILAGDGLLTLAFEIISQQIVPRDVAAECCADLAAAAGWQGMVAGQVADLEAEHQPLTSLDQLEAIHRRKTGRLLCCALTLGARIAGASLDWRSRLECYGKAVGLAFQITDDLLDVAGDPGKLGKGVRKDAEHGKLTYPALLGIDESRRRAAKLIDEACQALEPFGEKARKLIALARYVRERDR
jgi:geranylgeranyl diphosphate synthase type II